MKTREMRGGVGDNCSGPGEDLRLSDTGTGSPIRAHVGGDPEARQRRTSLLERQVPVWGPKNSGSYSNLVPTRRWPTNGARLDGGQAAYEMTSLESPAASQAGPGW
jgi:hypothetical protein